MKYVLNVILLLLLIPTLFITMGSCSVADSQSNITTTTPAPTPVLEPESELDPIKEENKTHGLIYDRHIRNGEFFFHACDDIIHVGDTIRILINSVEGDEVVNFFLSYDIVSGETHVSEQDYDLIAISEGRVTIAIFREIGDLFHPESIEIERLTVNILL